MLRASVLLPISLAALAICSVGCASPTNDESTDTAESDLIAGRAGAVFTASNDVNDNEVIAFRRAADGSLQRAASYSTTGKGSGDDLHAASSIFLSSDHRWLFVVNAGSNELSTFAVHGEQLALVDAVKTGGVRPVSVTEHHGVVFVLHAADGANNITGFYQKPDGRLAALPHSTRPLSAATTAPAQVSFSPEGNALLVTEKMTNNIDEFRIDPRTALPGTATVHASSGQTPFGFAMTARGDVVVSEAFGGADNEAALSSYQLGASWGLATISASVKANESAACWVALANHDRFAYTTNTKSGTISTYTVGTSGKLALAGGDGRPVMLADASKPTDIALTTNQNFMYVVESGTASLAILHTGADGTLTALPAVTGLPANVTGLAAE